MQSWIPFFVVLTSIALVLQAIILVALFLQLRRTAARIEQAVGSLDAKLAPVISRIQVLVEDVTPRITGIVSDASELSRMVRSQAQKVDRIASEALERLRLQLIHVDQVLTGAIEAVEAAGSGLRKTVWGPIVNATALVRGIQAGLEFFRTNRRRGGAPEPSAEHQDEGMFI